MPTTAYQIQDGIYRGFVAPVVLYGALAVAMRATGSQHRQTRSTHEQPCRPEPVAPVTRQPAHTPVAGTLMTPGYKILLAIAALGGVVAIYRFVFGLGAVSNLNDGYPWGIWIAFDVVTGTALACGGYAVALLVYILNKGKYHPLVRPAMLTSLLGYGLAILAVTLDLGRFWNLWKVPVFFWRWTHSPQLEVALCITAYIVVLLVELSPALFEKWKTSPNPSLRAWADRGLTFSTARWCGSSRSACCCRRCTSRRWAR